jgi:divalent metal cation (Fe/Co/Zn/Cd) transporter
VSADPRRPSRLLRRGRILEGITLGWNVAGLAVLAVAAVLARSVALAGFGLDSLIEIGASTVVLWELSGTGEDRQRRALRLIGGAFLALAAYLIIQSVIVLAAGYHPGHSPLGIGWTAVTAAAMFALAAGKARTGQALGNPVLITEGRVTLADGILAIAVLAGLVLNAAAGWWWSDPLAALVIVGYALREARQIFGQLPWQVRVSWRLVPSHLRRPVRRAMEELSRPGKPRRKGQSPRVYGVYRPPVRRRASTTVVAARVVLVAVALALVLALAAQL